MKVKTNIQNRKTVKRTAVVTIATVLILGGSVAAYNYFQIENGVKTQPGAPSSLESDNADSVQDDKVIVAPEEVEAVESLNLEKPTITRAEQDSSGKIRVSAIFTSPTSGTCKVIFEKNGEPTITKSAEIVVGPSYYACNGFLVPLAEFSVGGDWQLSIEHTLNDTTSSTEKQIIVITKS